jgi:hypothetical protein
MLDRQDDVLVNSSGDVFKDLNVTTVPEAVVKFCDNIDRNFATTADKLESTAHKLHGIADGLLNRAKQLREAAPQVSKDVHDWISFEQESLVREKFFRPLTQG